MKYSFAIAALLSNSKAISLRRHEPWDKASLPDCPSDATRTVMDDGKTHVSKYPYVGATCKMQVAGAADEEDDSLVGTPDPNGYKGLEHCPDFDERFTLANGRDRAVPYPQTGYNCTKDYAMLELDEMMKTDAPDPNGYKGLEHCPDFDERFTLANGRDKAIPYPQTGYNCTKDYALVQLEELIQTDAPDPNGWRGLEHCPDFDERMTLTDGKTRAVAWPGTGYNCNNEFALAQ